MLRRLIVLTAAAGAAGFAAYKLAVGPWYRDWGADPVDTVKALPGDDLVGDPTVVDTRAIEIAAPPAAVWPWLVQMGYGRAGWYSYDSVDMAGKSVREIVPEWQALAEGDIVPTQPGGGFRAAVVDPDHALVLYLDGDMVKEQIEAAKAAKVEAPSANVRATGQAMATGFPTDFAASWAMVLEPIGGDRTRFVTRFRIFMGEGKPQTRIGPLMGFGIFTMVRKQMLGIRDRVEGAAAPTAAASVAVPVVADEPPIDLAPDGTPESASAPA